MSDSNKIDNLDPSRHKQSVRQFVAFFHLHQHLPDMAFLVRVLTHFAKLPYENISKIVKLQENYTTSTRLRLPEEVMADYVEHRLGGTCFSLTFFLQTILTDCGYLCYPIIAHMPRMRNSHCALINRCKLLRISLAYIAPSTLALKCFSTTMTSIIMFILFTARTKRCATVSAMSRYPCRNS